MKLTNKLLVLFLLVTILFSCSSDDDNPTIPLGDYVNGYFIVNEGPFGNGTGTLTFVGNDGTITQDVYQTVNQEPLGNIVQSMTFDGNNAYIVVNNSHKIVVANRFTMEKIATIEGENISNPRFFAAINGKGYVSNWNDATNANDDFIAVIDLATNTVESTIAVGQGPEDLLINNNKLYVNLQGGFSQNNQVIVIDITNNTIVNTITVGDVPNDINIDQNGDIWVLCGGTPSFTGAETNGSLVQIRNDQVFENFDFNLTDHPQHLELNNNTSVLYYTLNGSVFSKPINGSSATEIPEFSGFYFGMEINDDRIYTLNAADFASEGELKVFDLNTRNLIETITTGIIPNSAVFQ
jgi:YVTN family beta-propeller protein